MSLDPIEAVVNHEIEHMKPVPVCIVKSNGDDLDVEEAPSTFGNWSNYKFLTGAEAPVQILSQDRNRKRAVIFVNSGFANSNINGFVSIGNQKQIAGITSATVMAQGNSGGLFVAGNTFVYESEDALWAVGDGSHSLTVTVLDERYRQL